MKKIGIEDLFKEIDIFRRIRESAEKTIVILGTMDTESKKIAENMQKVLGVNKLDSSKSINELVKAQEKANKLVQEAVKIDALKSKAEQQRTKATQELERLEAQYQKRLQETAKTTQQVTKTETERIKQEREQLKLTRDMERAEAQRQKQQERQDKLTKQQNSAYAQLAKSTRDLKNQSKDLGAQMLVLEQNGRKNSAEYRRLSTTYDQVTTQARKADQQLKQLDKTVGDNFRNVGNYEGAINKLSSAFGAFGVAFGVAPIIQNATSSVLNFELANSELAAVLGTTVDKTGDLQKVQRELGRGTAFTAGQVGELQVELAKLGFTTPEIINSSEAVLKLAGATRSDLARSSEIAGATLRGFGLQANEMDRVVNVMAKSFSVSALDLESFAESMKYVAPVAKQAGFTLEETSALLGVLSNQGIKGSQAGTSLRRIFTDMALTGKPAKEALAEVTKNGISLTDAFDEVGRTAQTALAVIGNNMGVVDEMSDSLLNADGAVNQMYDTMTNNLQGAFDRLSSAWEAYILDSNEATGASKSLQTIIDFLANNLVTIIDAVVLVTRMFLEYKVGVMAVTAVNKLNALSFQQIGFNVMKNIPFTRAYRLEQTNLARATKNATLAQKGLSTAMSKTPWGLIAVVASEAAFALYDYFTNTEEAEKATEKARLEEEARTQQLEEMNRKTEEGAEWVAKESQEFVGLITELKGTNAGSRERVDLINKINSTYGTTLKNLADETAFQKQLNLAVEEYIKYKRLQYQQQANEDKFIETLKKQELIADKIRKSGVSKATADMLLAGKASYSMDKQTMDALGKGGLFGKTAMELEKLAGEYQNANRELEALTKSTMSNNDQLGQYNYKTPKASSGTADLTKKTDDATEKAKEYKTALGDVNDYLDRNIELTQELLEIDQDRQVKALTDQIDQVVEDAKEDVKDTEVFDVQLRVAKEGEDQEEVDKENLDALIEADSELNDLIKQRYELEKKNLEQRAEFEKQELARKNEIDQAKELNDLIDDRDKLLADLEIKDGVALTKEQSDAKLKIEANYQEKLKELEKENAERNANLAQDQLIVDETLKDDLVKLEEDKTEAIKDENQKVLDSFKTNEDKKKEIAEKNAEDELAKEKEKQEAIQELIKATADYFIKRSEEKVAQLEKEIDKAEENQSYLEDLAKEGNISAQQSLAENQRIIDEANKRKLEEEKRQQRIKLAETALTTYSQKVEEGSKTPLADTIRDIALLQQFVATLPAFEEGIEDTGANGRGVDGRGGFHAILHPNERVVPKALNQKIGSMTNEQLATLAQEYQNGKIIRDGMQIASAMDTLLIANKIDELNHTIRNKPETNIELGEITQSMMEIVKSTKKGNTTMFNRYKIKK